MDRGEMLDTESQIAIERYALFRLLRSDAPFEKCQAVWRKIEALSAPAALRASAAPEEGMGARAALRSICKAGGDLGCSCADRNYQWFGHSCRENIAAAFKNMLNGEAALSPVSRKAEPVAARLNQIADNIGGLHAPELRQLAAALTPATEDGGREKIAKLLEGIPAAQWADRIERTARLQCVQEATSYNAAAYVARIDCFYDYEAKRLVQLLRALSPFPSVGTRDKP